MCPMSILPLSCMIMLCKMKHEKSLSSILLISLPSIGNLRMRKRFLSIPKTLSTTFLTDSHLPKQVCVHKMSTGSDELGPEKQKPWSEGRCTLAGTLRPAPGSTDSTHLLCGGKPTVIARASNQARIQKSKNDQVLSVRGVHSILLHKKHLLG